MTNDTQQVQVTGRVAMQQVPAAGVTNVACNLPGGRQRVPATHTIEGNMHLHQAQ